MSNTGNLSIGEIVNKPDLGKRLTKGTHKSLKAGMPTHTAINSTKDGESLKIELDFRKDSEFRKSADALNEDHTKSLLDVLARHSGITKEFIISVIYSDHWTESVALKKAQSALIGRIAKMVNSFPGLRKVDVWFKMSKKNWSQTKNAAFFYQLNKNISDWTFARKAVGGEWEKLELRSSLDRRLVGHFHSLRAKGEL